MRQLAGEVMLLSMLVGMVPHGKTEINPAVNAIQTLVAVRQNGAWRYYRPRLRHFTAGPKPGLN